MEDSGSVGNPPVVAILQGGNVGVKGGEMGLFPVFLLSWRFARAVLPCVGGAHGVNQ